MTPTFEFSDDGTSVDPLEVMFVKVKGPMLANEITYSKKATKYQLWQEQVRSQAGQAEWVWCGVVWRAGVLEPCVLLLWAGVCGVCLVAVRAGGGWW